MYRRLFSWLMRSKETTLVLISYFAQGGDRFPMIIPKAPTLTEIQLAEVKGILDEYRCQLQVIEGAARSIYAILGDERHELLINRIEGLEYIDRVDTIQSPHKLLDVRSELRTHQSVFGGVELGRDRVRSILITRTCCLRRLRL